MKRSLRVPIGTRAVLLICSCAMILASRGQGIPGGDAGFNAVVAQLFADVPAFSASVATALTNKADKTWVQVPMRMSKRDKRFRIEVDLEQMKGTAPGLANIASMRAIGMSKMASLVVPEEKGMVVVFPDLKAWTRVALAEADFAVSGFKVNKRRAGRDTVRGMECVRQRVTLTARDGTKTEATVWESTAHKGFPIRVLLEPEESTVLLDFDKIELSAPAANLFQAPKDFRQVSTISALMQEALSRATQSGR
jgi:hypothetical protein